MTKKLPNLICPTLDTDIRPTLKTVTDLMKHYDLTATTVTTHAGEVAVLVAFDDDSPNMFAAWLTALGVQKLDVTAYGGRAYFEPRPDVRYRQPNGRQFATARVCVFSGVRFLLTGIVDDVTRRQLKFVTWDRDTKGRMARSGRGLCSAVDFVNAYGAKRCGRACRDTRS